MSNDCIFCKIVKGEISVNKVYESENFISFPDKNPIVKGHTLVIPKKHYVNLMDLPSDLASEFIDVIKNVAEIRFKQGAEGFNLLMRNGNVAGQEVFHTHIHVVPRKKGDGISSLPT